LVRNGNVSSARFQVLYTRNSKALILCGKRLIQNALDIILKCPNQTSVEVGIDALHILQRHRLVQHHLVQCADEERIQESTMEDCKTNDAANKLEIVKMFRVNTGMRVDLKGIVV